MKTYSPIEERCIKCGTKYFRGDDGAADIVKESYDDDNEQDDDTRYTPLTTSYNAPVEFHSKFKREEKPLGFCANFEDHCPGDTEVELKHGYARGMYNYCPANKEIYVHHVKDANLRIGTSSKGSDTAHVATVGRAILKDKKKYGAKLSAIAAHPLTKKFFKKNRATNIGSPDEDEYTMESVPTFPDKEKKMASSYKYTLMKSGKSDGEASEKAWATVSKKRFGMTLKEANVQTGFGFKSEFEKAPPKKKIVKITKTTNVERHTDLRRQKDPDPEPVGNAYDRATISRQCVHTLYKLKAGTAIAEVEHCPHKKDLHVHFVKSTSSGGYGHTPNTTAKGKVHVAAIGKEILRLRKQHKAGLSATAAHPQTHRFFQNLGAAPTSSHGGQYNVDSSVFDGTREATPPKQLKIDGLKKATRTFPRKTIKAIGRANYQDEKGELTQSTKIHQDRANLDYYSRNRTDQGSIAGAHVYNNDYTKGDIDYVARNMSPKKSKIHPHLRKMSKKVKKDRLRRGGSGGVYEGNDEGNPPSMDPISTDAGAKVQIFKKEHRRDHLDLRRQKDDEAGTPLYHHKKLVERPCKHTRYTIRAGDAVASVEHCERHNDLHVDSIAANEGAYYGETPKTDADGKLNVAKVAKEILKLRKHHGSGLSATAAHPQTHRFFQNLGASPLKGTEKYNVDASAFKKKKDNPTQLRLTPKTIVSSPRPRVKRMSKDMYDYANMGRNPRGTAYDQGRLPIDVHDSSTGSALTAKVQLRDQYTKKSRMRSKKSNKAELKKKLNKMQLRYEGLEEGVDIDFYNSREQHREIKTPANVQRLPQWDRDYYTNHPNAPDTHIGVPCNHTKYTINKGEAFAELTHCPRHNVLHVDMLKGSTSISLGDTDKNKRYSNPEDTAAVGKAVLQLQKKHKATLQAYAAHDKTKEFFLKNKAEVSDSSTYDLPYKDKAAEKKDAKAQQSFTFSAFKKAPTSRKNVLRRERIRFLNSHKGIKGRVHLSASKAQMRQNASTFTLARQATSYELSSLRRDTRLERSVPLKYTPSKADLEMPYGAKKKKKPKRRIREGIDEALVEPKGHMSHSFPGAKEGDPDRTCLDTHFLISHGQATARVKHCPSSNELRVDYIGRTNLSKIGSNPTDGNTGEVTAVGKRILSLRKELGSSLTATGAHEQTKQWFRKKGAKEFNKGDSGNPYFVLTPNKFKEDVDTVAQSGADVPHDEESDAYITRHATIQGQHNDQNFRIYKGGVHAYASFCPDNNILNVTYHKSWKQGDHGPNTYDNPEHTVIVNQRVNHIKDVLGATSVVHHTFESTTDTPFDRLQEGACFTCNKKKKDKLFNNSMYCSQDCMSRGMDKEWMMFDPLGVGQTALDSVSEAVLGPDVKGKRMKGNAVVLDPAKDRYNASQNATSTHHHAECRAGGAAHKDDMYVVSTGLLGAEVRHCPATSKASVMEYSTNPASGVDSKLINDTITHRHAANLHREVLKHILNHKPKSVQANVVSDFAKRIWSKANLKRIGTVTKEGSVPDRNRSKIKADVDTYDPVAKAIKVKLNKAPIQVPKEDMPKPKDARGNEPLQCNKCGEVKTRDDFKNKTDNFKLRPDHPAYGKKFHCKSCDTKLNKTRHADEMERYKLEQGGSCAHCGDNDLSNLELAHVDEGSKKFSIGRRKRYKKNEVDAEVKKTVPLCKPCHKSITKAGGVGGWNSIEGKRDLSTDEAKAIHASMLKRHAQVNGKSNVAEAVLPYDRKNISQDTYSSAITLLHPDFSKELTQITNKYVKDHHLIPMPDGSPGKRTTEHHVSLKGDIPASVTHEEFAKHLSEEHEASTYDHSTAPKSKGTTLTTIKPSPRYSTLVVAVRHKPAYEAREKLDNKWPSRYPRPYKPHVTIMNGLHPDHAEALAKNPDFNREIEDCFKKHKIHMDHVQLNRRVEPIRSNARRKHYLKQQNKET
jgi:hypothetical protein